MVNFLRNCQTVFPHHLHHFTFSPGRHKAYNSSISLLYDQAVKMAIPLLSVHPLPDQCLLYLQATPLTDLPTYLPLLLLLSCFSRVRLCATP